MEYRITNRGGRGRVNTITSGGNESDDMMNIITSQGNWNKNREDTPASPGKRHGAEETKIVSQRNGNFRTTNQGGMNIMNTTTSWKNGSGGMMNIVKSQRNWK
jgi:hypothetical protein